MRQRRLLGSVIPLEDRTVPAVFTVSALGDAHVNGQTTLREALASANADNTPDTIDFDPTLVGQVIRLNTVGDTSVGPSALAVTSPVTVLGPGVAVGRNTAGPKMRLFVVTSAGSLTLSGLTLQDGLVQGSTGG